VAVLLVFACLATAGAAQILGMLIAALRFRVPIELVGLFIGPKLFDLPLRRFVLRVHLLPLGGYVKLKEEGFYALAPLARVAILLAGPAAMLLLGVALLGPEAAWALLHRTVSRLLGLGQSAPALKPLGWNGMLGLISLSLGVLNLLPLPPLNGGQALVTLLFGRRCTPAVMAKAVQVGHYVILALFLAATFVELKRIYPR